VSGRRREHRQSRQGDDAEFRILSLRPSVRERGVQEGDDLAGRSLLDGNGRVGSVIRRGSLTTRRAGHGGAGRAPPDPRDLGLHSSRFGLRPEAENRTWRAAAARSVWGTRPSMNRLQRFSWRTGPSYPGTRAAGHPPVRPPPVRLTGHEQVAEEPRPEKVALRMAVARGRAYSIPVAPVRAAPSGVAGSAASDAAAVRGREEPSYDGPLRVVPSGSSTARGFPLGFLGFFRETPC